MLCICRGIRVRSEEVEGGRQRTEIVNGRCRGETGARRERKCGGARRLVEFSRRRRSYEKLQTGVGCFCGEPGKVRRSEIMFVLIPYLSDPGKKALCDWKQPTAEMRVP